MAETKRRGRPPKSENTPKDVEKKIDNSQEELIKFVDNILSSGKSLKVRLHFHWLPQDIGNNL